MPRTGLQSGIVAGSTPDETAGSAPVVDGKCDQRSSPPQRHTLPLRSARSCINAGSPQRCL
eukprot:6213476-Pleurochrysis_carterae.AAC.1